MRNTPGATGQLMVYSVLVVLPWLSFSGAEATPPNILLILSDDHACQAIGSYGSKINRTPHIDRLSREGVRFDRCYVTNSICGPSRACILTGKYSHVNGFYTNAHQFNSRQPTIATRLQDAGYQTAVIGKWHLGSNPVGFDHWDILPGQGRYYAPEFYTSRGKTLEEGYVTDVIDRKTREWLQTERRPDRPFLLMVQHKAPHRSWMPGPDHLGDFAEESIPEPQTLFDDYSHRADAARHATLRIGNHMNPSRDLMVFERDSRLGRTMAERTPKGTMPAWYATFGDSNHAYLEDPPTGQDKTRWHYQRYIKNYLRCVASVDDSVGRLLDYLDESGLSEETLVIYTSDQGFFLGEHGWYDKRFMYEESLRTPLLIRWPGVTSPGSVVRSIVSNLDFAETIVDAAELVVPDDMQGASLRPLLRGETAPGWRRTFYYHFYEGPDAVHSVHKHYGVTDGRHKLIHYYELGQWELFDLEADPRELRSVYDSAHYEDTQRLLKAELVRLRQQLGVE